MRVKSPEGTAEMADMFQSSLRDPARFDFHPGVKTPGYFQMSLRNKGRRPEQQMIAASVENIRDPVSKIGGDKNI